MMKVEQHIHEDSQRALSTKLRDLEQRVIELEAENARLLHQANIQRAWARSFYNAKVRAEAMLQRVMAG